MKGILDQTKKTTFLRIQTVLHAFLCLPFYKKRFISTKLLKNFVRREISCKKTLRKKSLERKECMREREQ